MNETRAVGGLATLFCVTLYVVYRLEEPVIWLVWAIAMAVTSGATLVTMNR